MIPILLKNVIKFIKIIISDLVSNIKTFFSGIQKRNSIVRNTYYYLYGIIIGYIIWNYIIYNIGLPLHITYWSLIIILISCGI